MKNHINEAMWKKLEEALMEAQVPYSITWDSHWDGISDTMVYDKHIRVEPMILQKEVKIV